MAEMTETLKNEAAERARTDASESNQPIMRIGSEFPELVLDSRYVHCHCPNNRSIYQHAET